MTIPHPRDLSRVAETPAPPSIDLINRWDLVSAAQRGDRDAFAQIYVHYREVVFRYVLFRMGDRMLAEDITQETFFRALRRIDSVSYQGRDLGAWLVTIARNLIYDHCKSSRVRQEVVDEDTANCSWHHPAERNPVEDAVIAAEQAAAIRHWVDRLGADQQMCIRYRFMQGLSVTETADLMGRGDGALKALQHRAVRRLAAMMTAAGAA